MRVGELATWGRICAASARRDDRVEALLVWVRSVVMRDVKDVVRV